MHLFSKLVVKNGGMDTFPAKWSARRLSLSRRERYAPQTSHTWSFDCEPAGSWFVRRSRYGVRNLYIMGAVLLSLFSRIIGDRLAKTVAMPSQHFAAIPKH